MFFLVHLDVYNEISQIFNRLENSKGNYLEKHPATVSGHKWDNVRRFAPWFEVQTSLIIIL